MTDKLNTSATIASARVLLCPFGPLFGLHHELFIGTPFSSRIDFFFFLRPRPPSKASLGLPFLTCGQYLRQKSCGAMRHSTHMAWGGCPILWGGYLPSLSPMTGVLP